MTTVWTMAWVLLATSIVVPGVEAQGVGGVAPPNTVRVRNPRAGIPINGAIVLESIDGSLSLVEVSRGSDPQLLSGDFAPIGFSNAGQLFAWHPDAPFELGPHSVTVFSYQQVAAVQQLTLEMVEPIDDAVPEVTSEPSASGMLSPSFNECCSNADGGAPQHCGRAQRASLVLDAGLSSREGGAKLNQYLFAIADAGDAVLDDRPFVPFEELPALTYFDLAEQYCFELSAKNVVTLEVRSYPDLQRCVPRGDVPVGLQREPVEPVLFDDSHCPSGPAASFAPPDDKSEGEPWGPCSATHPASSQPRGPAAWLVLLGGIFALRTRSRSAARSAGRSRSSFGPRTGSRHGR